MTRRTFIKVGGNDSPAVWAGPSRVAMTATDAQSDTAWSKRTRVVPRVTVKVGAHTWHWKKAVIWCFLGSPGVSDYVQTMSMGIMGR